jgi:uncharacterized protein (DUF111 family)
VIADSPAVERSLVEIRDIIRSANGLSARVRERALEIFDLIGQAEAKIHEVPIEKIHFHEVGAVDSIVDICGGSLALELLGEPEVYAAPPPLGSGTVETAHGKMPVPTPATLELLKDRPVRFEGIGEFLLERVGYGVGTQQLPDRANVLRASLGRLASEEGDSTWVVEANLDDCNPQLLGSLLETMLELGAMDAFVLPATMKKSRPGHLVGVVVSGSRRQAISDALLRESTTLGVRYYRVERMVLERSVEEVSTRFGPVRIKLGHRGGTVLNAQPEFEDCRRIAQKEKVPIKQVWAEALASYHQSREAREHDRQAALGSADSRFSKKDR